MSDEKIHYKINIERINFLIDFFKITKEKFLELTNEGLKSDKNKIKFEDFENKIELSKIKRIDKIFNKGLCWYIDTEKPNKKNNSSIFFRKKSFNSKIGIEDIKIIDEFEKKRILTSILCNNIDFKLHRKIKKFEVNDDVNEIVEIVRYKFKEIEEELIKEKKIKKIHNKNTKENDKNYLKNLFRIIEEFNIFVFEYLENHNKKEKVNFEGFYIKNIIVVKRQENLRKEIFTLLHEFAHYLLEEEEIDENIDNNLKDIKNNKVEKWCNEFAFKLLLGDYKETFYQKLPNKQNNFCQEEIINLVKKTYLNPISFYTNFLINKKIDYKYYTDKRDEIDRNFKRKIEREKKQRKEENKLKKSSGQKISPMIPKEIKSELFYDIVKINFDRGKIDDRDFCNYLNIKNEKSRMETFLSK